MSLLMNAIDFVFNRKAAAHLPNTDFAVYLSSTFDRKTAIKVLDAFKKMSLPAPQTSSESVQATEGSLVFLNRHGVVIRIEQKNTRNSPSGLSSDRINDSAWILKPLASIDLGRAVIEICPGCNRETNSANVAYLCTQLRIQNIDYWDAGTRNNGLLPIKTPSFPKGIPVVIDRLAVKRLADSIKPIRQALNEVASEAQLAQEILYAPLRRAFDQAWPDAQKMEQFWKLCTLYVAEGKLIAGWKASPDPAATAMFYEARLKSADKAATPTAVCDHAGP